MAEYTDQRVTNEQLVDVYCALIRSGLCPHHDPPVKVRIVTKGHAHIAMPCKHVLWYDWGHHRPGLAS